jgi:hypothetical protein
MNIDHILEMFLVGQVADSDGEPILHDDRQPIMFATAVVRMKCGYTGGSKLSMGHNGLHANIDVENYQLHDTKEGVYSVIKHNKLDVDDFYPIDDYLKSVLTDATINNLYRRMTSWRVWIHGDFNLMKWVANNTNGPVTIDVKDKK